MGSTEFATPCSGEATEGQKGTITPLTFIYLLKY